MAMYITPKEIHTTHLPTTTTQLDDDDELLSPHTQSPTYLYIHTPTE